MLRAAALGGAAAGRVLAALPGHSRLLSAAAAPEQRTALELAMAKTLQESSLGVRHMQLRDVSGGCGAQFALHIVADAFEGVPLVRQQRLVNDALKDYLKTVHSLTMQTVAPSKWGGVSS